MSNFKTEHGASKINLVQFKTNIEDSVGLRAAVSLALHGIAAAPVAWLRKRTANFRMADPSDQRASCG